MIPAKNSTFLSENIAQYTKYTTAGTKSKKGSTILILLRNKAATIKTNRKGACISNNPLRVSSLLFLLNKK